MGLIKKITGGGGGGLVKKLKGAASDFGDWLNVDNREGMGAITHWFSDKAEGLGRTSKNLGNMVTGEGQESPEETGYFSDATAGSERERRRRMAIQRVFAGESMMTKPVLRAGALGKPKAGT